MAEKSWVWSRLRRMLRPERETYGTRRSRGGDPAQGPVTQVYEATDYRRHGGTGPSGGH